MKNYYLLLIAILLVGSSCQRSDRGAQAATTPQTAAPANGGNFTEIQWIDSVLDKGTIYEGEKLEIRFRFKNAGSKPLVIEDVRGSCGCTVVDKPEKPIAPGEESAIRAEFDSKGKPGPNMKSVYVRSNTPQRTSTLVFNVVVNKKS